MMRRFVYCAVMLLMAANSMAQKMMTPPHVMVVPDMVYCKDHGYVRQYSSQGFTQTVPDYERALSEDKTLHAILTQVAQMITDRNGDIVIVDLVEAINSARNDVLMSAANDGDATEGIDEAIIRNSEVDILVKVQFDVVKNGPEHRVSYVLNGTDAYTNQVFAPVSGMGKPSTSASAVVLVREAAGENMDAFLTKMLSYYQGMLRKGRMVTFDIKMSANSDYTMNSRVGQYTLREQIEDFLYDNSVDGNGIERVKSGNTFLHYQGVYIPLTANIRGRQRRQGAKDVAQRLLEFLETNDISAEYKVFGLGKVNIYIK